MLYAIMWPKDDTNTYLAFLTPIAMQAWKELQEQGDSKVEALRNVVGVMPGCSLSLKKKSILEVKKEIYDRHEVLDSSVP